jgi:transposase
VNTIPQQIVDGCRRRRLHSDEFNADAVAACLQPGVSMAAVAMSRGVNANLLRRWARLAELRCDQVAGEHGTAMRTPTPTSAPAFVPLQLPAPTVSLSDIRIELRRGATTVAVTWPVDAATQCAAWMRELLR